VLKKVSNVKTNCHRAKGKVLADSRHTSQKLVLVLVVVVVLVMVVYNVT